MLSVKLVELGMESRIHAETVSVLFPLSAERLPLPEMLAFPAKVAAFALWAADKAVKAAIKRARTEEKRLLSL